MTSKSRRLTQIIQNANTKDVTFDAVTINGALTLNGTTTTINSTVVTIDDPIFTLGGDIVPTTDDNKDRGIEFRWHNGTSAKVGFFGFDDSTGYLTFIPDATNSSEVFSGALGDIQATNFRGALIGNASTASTLQTARTIAISGAVAGTATSFDGSTNITIPTTVSSVQGGIVYGASTTAYATTAAGTANQLLKSNGTAAPTFTTASISVLRNMFTATAGQTTFSVSYTVNNIMVFMNGILLDTTDYTATNGTSVVLATGADVGDEITVIEHRIALT